MNYSLKKLLLVGISVELLIFAICYLMEPSTGETFRHAARYSGRVSLVIFLITFYLFATSFPEPVADNKPLKNWLTLFAVLHVIHFGFLATNVFLNDIPIVPVKLTGGALAYTMIVAAPLLLHKVKTGGQLTYFYYVSIVMIVTYIARIKGDFVGADPFWFHYVAIASVGICCIIFGWMIYRQSPKRLTS